MRVVFLEVDTERSWAVASIGPAFIGACLRAHGHEVAARPRRRRPDRRRGGGRGRRASEPDLLGVSLTTRQWLRAPAPDRRDPRADRRPGHRRRAAPDLLARGGARGAGLRLRLPGRGRGGDARAGRRRSRAVRPTDGIRERLAARRRRGPRCARRSRRSTDCPSWRATCSTSRRGTVHMTTQRGCPFPCTYCAARMYNELYDATGEEYGRRRSHDNVLAELAELRAQGRLGYVIFLDDTFTIHHPWVKEFCRVYGAEVGAPFSLHARVETVSEELLHMLAAAGCKQITYGVESGSERVRREVMRRPVTNQRFRDVFRWTREAGILLTANFMLGLPGETRDDLSQTLDLAEELDVLDFGYFVFYPYPGTQLFRVCMERGLSARGLPGAPGEPPRVDPRPARPDPGRHRRVLRPLHRAPPPAPRAPSAARCPRTRYPAPWTTSHELARKRLTLRPGQAFRSRRSRCDGVLHGGALVRVARATARGRARRRSPARCRRRPRASRRQDAPQLGRARAVRARALRVPAEPLAHAASPSAPSRTARQSSAGAPGARTRPSSTRWPSGDWTQSSTLRLSAPSNAASANGSAATSQHQKLMRSPRHVGHRHLAAIEHEPDPAQRDGGPPLAAHAARPRAAWRS